MMAPDLFVLRERLGLSQAQFCAAYRIPIGTYRSWEQGRRRPHDAAVALLIAIEREPQTMRRLLSEEGRWL